MVAIQTSCVRCNESNFGHWALSTFPSLGRSRLPRSHADKSPVVDSDSSPEATVRGVFAPLPYFFFFALRDNLRRTGFFEAAAFELSAFLSISRSNSPLRASASMTIHDPSPL